MYCGESLLVEDDDRNSNTLVAGDPSNTEYICGEERTFVYVNLGKTIVSLDIAGVCGFIIASVASTIFIGIAVYSLAAQNKSKTYQASDRHPLMPNDGNEAVYSPLNNDGKATYSQLAKKRFQ
ncbi:T-cell surface glycoprotein CD3 gamma chain-like [Rhinoraja longicauda]